MKISLQIRMQEKKGWLYLNKHNNLLQPDCIVTNLANFCTYNSIDAFSHFSTERAKNLLKTTREDAVAGPVFA